MVLRGAAATLVIAGHQFPHASPGNPMKEILDDAARRSIRYLENLDSRAVQSLGVALAEALPKIVPQVIVITHENLLVESTPGRVIRFSRDKLKGEDTRVEADG